MERQAPLLKQALLTISGLCAAATGLLIWYAMRTPPVNELAHQLENAWADHHTVA
jgi:hypothetical protein